MKRQCVIIGAGPAGLTAAHELLCRAVDEWDVTILEESQAIGGISRTIRHNGNRMDIGGHRFFSKDSRVTDWWNERMPMQGEKPFDDLVLGRECPLVEGGPDPEKEDRVMLSRHRVSRIYYDHKFLDYPILFSPATLRTLGPITTASVGISYLSSVAKRLPEDSLENFYINRFGRKLYSMFFEGHTMKLWGRHPREISADWGAQRVKGISMVDVLTDTVAKLAGRKDKQEAKTSLIERFSYPKFGPGQLWEQTADEVEQMGGKLVHGACASALEVAEDGTIVAVATADGRRFEADCVMSTMPLADLVAAMPDATDDAAKIAAGLPYRDFVTIGLLVPQLELTNETNLRTLGNIVPDNWIYIQDSSVKLARIQIFNNWSPYLVADPVRTVWLGLEYICCEGDDFWNMDDVERVEFATGELVRMGVLSANTKVLDSHVEHVKKAYPAYFDTYDRIDELISWIDTHPNLFCLGRNGQHRYNNMDHAMLTAFNAVDVLLSGSTDRSSVWGVNTEDEYHED